MHVSLPIVVMAAVVAQGVTATPILQYESERFASPESHRDSNHLTKRAPFKSKLINALIPLSMYGAYLSSHWIGRTIVEKERLEEERIERMEKNRNMNKDKQDETPEGNEEDDEYGPDGSVERDGNANEDEDEDEDIDE